MCNVLVIFSFIQEGKDKKFIISKLQVLHEQSGMVALS